MATPSEPMLSVSGLHTFYGRIEALRGVDVEVNEGEIVTLIGANGAGKSTLLMTICGNPRAAEGQIVFEREDITELPTYEIVRRGIAQSPDTEGERRHVQVVADERRTQRPDVDDALLRGEHHDVSRLRVAHGSRREPDVVGDARIP